MTLLGMTTSRTFNWDAILLYRSSEEVGIPFYIPVTPHWTRPALEGDCEAPPHDYLPVSIAR